MTGTRAGEIMLGNASTSLWGNPMWDSVDVRAGGVMPGEAQLLYGITRALRPITVLEVGTSHGYSTVHLAAACRDNKLGEVYTVENDTARQEQARQNIEEAGLSEQVIFCQTIPALNCIDLLFFDAGHEIEDLLLYTEHIAGINDQTVIVIHDAAYKDHAVTFADYFNYNCILLNTSLAGLAILSKGFEL